jgi:hypothetical protein
MDQWRTLSFFYSIHPEVCAWLSVLVPTLFLYKYSNLDNACLLSIVVMLLFKFNDNLAGGGQRRFREASDEAFEVGQMGVTVTG